MHNFPQFSESHCKHAELSREICGVYDYLWQAMDGQNETIENQPARKGLFRRNKAEADGAAYNDFK